MGKNDVAIRVQSLGKAYRVAAGPQAFTTAAEALAARLRRPSRRTRTDTFWALQGIDIEVRRGETLGIIGRNGAGKSTLLKLLSRITEPTEGRIELYGNVGSLLEVGTGFHQELTGRENIFLNGAILGMSRREIARQFDAIVDFAGVERFLDTPVKRYSSGMYVRLAFAVAAHLRTEILVVDEVLAVGDAEFQRKCLGKMQDVASGGRTVLFVSHNEGAVRRLCGRAVLLRNGRVVVDSTPAGAFAAYRAARGAAGFDATNRTASSAELEIVDAQLTLDGAEASELPSGAHPTLTYAIAVHTPRQFSPELVIRDANGMPVLFGPVGLTQGRDYCLPVGRHVLHIKLHLPTLATGRYTMDLMLAETNVRFYDYLEEALVMDVSSANSHVTGWNFYQRGQGCVLLETTDVSGPPEGDIRAARRETAGACA